MRLYQEVGNRLRDGIAKGEYPLATRLPPERNIAEKFNVSRSVVREALIMLELEKLVDVRKGSGVYVIGMPYAPYSSGLRDLDENAYGPFEMLQARQLLESEIAAFAAIQATKGDILEMRAAIEQEHEALLSGCFDESEDELFHCLLARATQNSVLVAMVEDMWRLREHNPLWKGVHSHTHDFSYRWNWLDDHQKILQAVLRRDAKGAKQSMWQHLENVKTKLLEISDPDDPAFDGFLFESTRGLLNKL